jgi:hypothetical protein
MLLTVEGKWIATIVHMTKSKFLNFPQISLVNHIYPFCLSKKHPTIYPISENEFEG